MAVAIVGLPGGTIVPEDLKQLKEYCRLPADGGRPLLGTFEIRGREWVLYWRDLAKGQIVEVPIDLIARVPGGYRGPDEQGVFVLHRRQQALGRAAGGEDRGGGVGRG